MDLSQAGAKNYSSRRKIRMQLCPTGRSVAKYMFYIADTISSDTPFVFSLK